MAAVAGRGERRGHPNRTRALAGGRILAPETLGDRTRYPRLTLRAVAGRLRADFTTTTLDGDVAVCVTAIAGHVQLTVPRSWPVAVRTAGMVLSRVTETGERDQVDLTGPGTIGLHLLGVCGAISLVRI